MTAPSDLIPIPQPRLQDLSVLVTGAAGGIGTATCARLLGEGARVLAVDLDKDRLDTLANELGTSDRIQTATADLTDSAQASDSVRAAVEAFGRLDGVVSIAGGSGRRAGDGPVHECTDEGWAWTLESNLTSHFRLARSAIPALLEGGGGSIVLLGSVLGVAGGGWNFATHAYAAAKAGIGGLARSMASYYGPDGVRVNVLAPALVATPMSQRAQTDPEMQQEIRERQPLGGIIPAEAIASAAAFLVSTDSAHMTGQTLTVDGGWQVR